MALPLPAESGAKFIATVRPVDGGQFQATCHAILDLKSSMLEEAPEYHLCESEYAARAWVHQMAAARGFTSIFWDVGE